mgnify:FL=1
MSKGPRDRIVVGIHSCEEALRVNSSWVKEVIIMEGKDRDQQSITQQAQKKNL